MSSPESMNPPEVKRRRLTQACSLCHQRKTRCDGQKPECGTCIRNGSSCTYPPLTQKRGPHRGNNDRVEKRLEQLEKKLDNLSEIIGKFFQNSEQKIESNKSIPTVDSSPSLSYPLKTCLGFSLASPIENSKLSQILTHELSQHLLKLYFEIIHPGFPIIHPASFFQRYEKNEIPSYLLYSMFSIVAKFSGRAEVKNEIPWKQGEIFETCACAQIVGINDFNLDYLASLVLMAKSLYQRGMGSRGWIYGGMAVRVAHFLDIHKVDEHSMNGDITSPTNWITIERQRRLWWSCYTIDCYSCNATGRPPAIQDQLTFVSLPIENGTWDADPNNDIPSNIKPSSGEPLYTHYIRLITILNKVGRFINTPKMYRPTTMDTKKHLDVLDTLLVSWPIHLPDIIKLENVPLNPPPNYRGPPVYQVWSLYALYYSVIIILHSSRLGGDAFDLSASQKCLKSADMVTQLMSECFSFYPLSSTPFYFNYCLFLANTIYLDSLLHLSWEQLTEGDNKFALNFKMIHENFGNWSMAEHYCRILKDIYDGKTRTSLNQSSITIPSSLAYSQNLSLPVQLSSLNEVKVVPKFRVNEINDIQMTSFQPSQFSAPPLPNPYANLDLGLLNFMIPNQNSYVMNQPRNTDETSLSTSSQDIPGTNIDFGQLGFSSLTQSLNTNNGSTQASNEIYRPEVADPDLSYLNPFSMFFPSQAF